MSELEIAIKKLEVEKAEKEKEIKLLREAVKKLQADIDRLEKKNKRYEKYLKNKDEEHEKVLEFIETEKENEELKQDNIHQWEERCKLTFELEKNEANIEIKDKVIDLLIDDVYDNDNFWRLKCGFERIEKGKEKEYIKERFYKKVEEEK